MSKVFFRVFGVVVLIGVVAAAMGAVAAQDANYIGKWQGTDSSGGTATVIFGQDGSFTMFIDGTEVIGDSADIKVRYAFDLSKDPAWLDIIVYDADGKELGRMLSIVKFTDPDTMLWRMYDDHTVRPTEFDENDTEDTVKITRIK